MSKINTKRCTPVQMRKALEMVEALKQSGVEFIPVPVLNDEDRAKLINIANTRLGNIAAQAEAEEAGAA